MPARRVYTTNQLIEALQMSRRTLERHIQKRDLPFLEEVRPRAGHIRRYRADLVDRYLENRWGSAPRRIA